MTAGGEGIRIQKIQIHNGYRNSFEWRINGTCSQVI